MNFDAEDAARADAERVTAEMIERIQAAGDEVADELTAELDLPAGMRVVFDTEPVIKLI